MSTYTIGYDEKYKCVDCGKVFFNHEEVETKWRCPICNGALNIAAPALASGHIMNRIPVTELRKTDSVHIPHTNELYEVIVVENIKDSRVRVAYRNFGQRIYFETDYVDVAVGGYFSENW